MKEIDIKAICAAKELDYETVAKQLFPENKHARLALNRVVAKDAVLDANQISKLSLMAGIPIGELFTGGNWKASNTEGVYTFENGDFTAKLNTVGIWTTVLLHKNSLFHSEVFHDKKITLEAFIKMLNSQILKFNTNADFRN